MATCPIPVLIVEDSPVALTILKRILAGSPEVEIVGVARDGVEALELIPQVNPKVICTDLYMPKMDGLKLTQQVMAKCPRPILVISSSVDQQEDAQNVFQLLQAGALDVFSKPRVDLLSDYEQIKRELISRIKILAGVSVFTQHASIYAKTSSSASRLGDRTAAASTLLPSNSTLQSTSSFSLPKAVAIGASTGGPQAFYTILKALPANFPAPIFCVQHISQGFLQGLVNWLALECSLRVVIAQAGDIPQPGTVYFSPDYCHLQLDAQGRIFLSNEAAVCGHRPSVTVLFQSIAAYYRRAATGILLTGMGRDGADGLMTIAQAGGTTIAQNEQTCVVFGMPKEAIALGAAQQILSIHDIAPMLIKHCSMVR
ncbi:MAG: chemotaxis response regulator protein-glutamate methylesterase [Elainellaceae cyanobacterium]